MKKIFFVGTSKDDLREFPEGVRYTMGKALLEAQKGGKSENAKVLTGFGSAKVLEILDDDRSGTYRTVYTVEMAGYIFVVHAFQKKSKEGGKVPPRDDATIKRRIKEVGVIYKELKKEEKS